MISPGQVGLFNFPHTDQSSRKMRPALLVAKLPGLFDDWLTCMISSQLRQCVEGFDVTMATLKEVEALMSGGSARVQR